MERSAVFDNETLPLPCDPQVCSSRDLRAEKQISLDTWKD